MASLEPGQLCGPAFPQPDLHFSLFYFTDCGPTAGSSVDAEGQVNKSTASYAKLIKQRLNCAALAHPHKGRYRRGVCTHTCTYLKHRHIRALEHFCNQLHGYILKHMGLSLMRVLFKFNQR